jgi:hypothetical protein
MIGIIAWFGIGFIVAIIMTILSLKINIFGDIIMTRGEAIQIFIILTAAGPIGLLGIIMIIIMAIEDSPKWRKFWDKPLVNDEYYKSKKER